MIYMRFGPANDYKPSGIPFYVSSSDWSDDLHAVWASKRLQISWNTILRDLELLNTQNQHRSGALHELIRLEA